MAKKFGEMSREEKLELLTAWVDGVPIQRMVNNNEWRQKNSAIWNSMSAYRIALQLPEINWDHVHPDYIALARDECGTAYLYTAYPECGNTMWRRPSNRRCLESSAFASYKPGTVPWRESIIYRPGYEPK